jgi:microcystin-dependent protein
MQNLSLDPLVYSDDLYQLRDSVQLDLQKIQDYINLLKQSVNPTGSILGLESASAGPGYLLMDGSSFSAATYPELATYLGGTTLPDYRGRVLVGRDAAQVEFDTLGEVGGAKTHLLTEAEMPSHFHVQRNAIGGGSTHIGTAGVAPVVDPNGQDSESITTSAGLDTPHNNLQPYRVVNWFIKT